MKDNHLGNLFGYLSIHVQRSVSTADLADKHWSAHNVNFTAICFFRV